jgi:hypothetical protein
MTPVSSYLNSGGSVTEGRRRFDLIAVAARRGHDTVDRGFDRIGRTKALFAAALYLDFAVAGFHGNSRERQAAVDARQFGKGLWRFDWNSVAVVLGYAIAPYLPCLGPAGCST